MSKRKTKAQRELEQRKALWQRVYDVYCGACGREFDEDFDTEASEWASHEETARIMPALRDLFRGPVVSDLGQRPIRHEHDWLFTLQQIDSFGTPGEAYEFLWRNGVRA